MIVLILANLVDSVLFHFFMTLKTSFPSISKFAIIKATSRDTGTPTHSPPTPITFPMIHPLGEPNLFIARAGYLFKSRFLAQTVARLDVLGSVLPHFAHCAFTTSASTKI